MITEEPIYLFGAELAMPDSMMEQVVPFLQAGGAVPANISIQVTICKLDRDVALLSMDRTRILDYANKYGVDMSNMPESDDSFMLAVHTAIVATRSLPMHVRVYSKKIIVERGLTPLDDGEVPYDETPHDETE